MAKSISNLDPWYVTGFVDGEGCFSLCLNTENKRRKNKTISSYTYWVTVFRINLREDDCEILNKLKRYFGCGTVNISKSARCQISSLPGAASFQVTSRHDITSRIIPHFDKYPLRARKLDNYKLWRESVLILSNADTRRLDKFSKQMLTKKENTKLFEVKRKVAESQSGGLRINSLKALEKQPGKRVLE